ncbi:MAG: aspartyl protease family protein [Oligoflexia bacterium]|nr:aspartyl protease family protein [Oligoflexia bacterium]
MYKLKPTTTVITKSFDLRVSSIETCGRIINPNKKIFHETKKILWDTGATHSCLDIKVIEKLGLERIGIGIPSKTAGGIVSTYSYYVDINLSNKMPLYYRIVSGLSMSESLGVDFLIGMDIIRQGDFKIITGQKQNKIFTFSFDVYKKSN